MVFPVPLRPKKTVTSPSLRNLLETVVELDGSGEKKIDCTCILDNVNMYICYIHVLYTRYIEHPTLALVLYPTTNKKNNTKTCHPSGLPSLALACILRIPPQGGINGWNPKIEVFGSDNFLHENWMTFRFHVKFRWSMCFFGF